MLLQLTPKELFLSRITSKTQSKSKYSRYTGLPLRYAGGKSLGVGYIVEHIPDNISNLVSPFIGGASVEIACAKELGIRVYGYDIFDMLTNYWNIQINNPQGLADRLSEWLPSKLLYQYVKMELKDIWDGKPHSASALELAAMYWFNHNLSYGPGFLGWMSKIYESEKRYVRAVAKVRNFHCDKLSVANGTFDQNNPKSQQRIPILRPTPTIC